MEKRADRPKTDHTKQIKRARRRRRLKRSALVFLALVFIAASAIIYLFYKRYKHIEEVYSALPKSITVEAGTPVSREMFLGKDFPFTATTYCNLDFEDIDVTKPQIIRFRISTGFYIEPFVLDISDTTPPTGDPVPATRFSFEVMPTAEELVTNVYDVSGDVTVALAEGTVFEPGENTITVYLTDPSGNRTNVEVPVTVYEDKIAPEIIGLKELTYWIGETISFKKDVTVRDDRDNNPSLEVDTSGVNFEKEGEYFITYRAKDNAGNVREEAVKLRVRKHSSTFVPKDVLMKKAQEVLSEITKPEMSDMEKALQIFYWCRYHLHYAGHADTTSSNRAAYDALTTLNGTCYSYAYAAKALLDCAGIENQVIKRYPYFNSKHYWNFVKINGEWYHCDSTPRHEYNSYIFMYTGTEIRNFRVNNYNGYDYETEKYPVASENSVQRKIDYARHKILK